MKTHHIGIVLNGVTGRMGTNQHLNRSIAAIIKQGGLRVGNEEVIMPHAILVGRNLEKVKKVAQGAGLPDGALKITSDLAAALADPAYSIYFDAQSTDRRVPAMLQAIAAGKHVYCEKPSATNTPDALALYHAAQKAGIKHGVVQDKLWLPGFLKLKHLIEAGFFGEILSVRGEFGYWVFQGDTVPAQRPSWNYKMEAGGGMILDMLCHFRYMLDNIFGKVKSVSCLGATHIKKRWDENKQPYVCTAEDAAYSTFLLENGIVCHFNASWATRVRRDDLFVMQVDGTQGSAVAGLRECLIQPLAETPRPVWNPDVDSTNDFYGTWKKAPAHQVFENAFKTEWELFLKHVVKNDPFPWTLLEGAKGVQLGELGIQSWKERRWVDVGALE